MTQHSHWLNQWHSVSVVQFIQKIMAGGCPVVVAQKQSIGCTNQVSRIWFTTAASHYIILYVCLITFKFVSFQCEARRSRLWMLNSALWKLWMCFRGKYESSCCIRNNAFGKSSKQQIIYAAIAYEDILLPATWLGSLLHTINTSILCHEIVPKSACALSYHSYWPYKNDGCHRCWNWKELEIQLLWSLSGIQTLPRMLLCTVGAKKTFNHLNAVTIIYGVIKLPVIAATIYNYMLTTSLCAFRAKLKSLTSSEGRRLLVK